MGAQFSALYYTVKSLVGDYKSVSKRISLSPGIPQLNGSLPFWTVPNSPIARHGETTPLPGYADVIVIGSGISGTAVAKTLLESYPSGSQLKVVMLEAREACSGATGRNGGHACPNVYNEYAQLKADHGAAAAVDILRFRLAHIEALISVAKEENLLDASQVRIVDDYDAFLEPEMLLLFKEQLNTFLKEVPEDVTQSFKVIEEVGAIQDLQLSPLIKGCIVKPGASLHPYRLVTGILSNLLSRHSNFSLFTRTPCTNIRTDDDCYVAITPRGEVKARHIIHATNAWSSHLLPGMRRKIVPLRGHMSAQRPGQGLMPARNPCSSNKSSPHWAGSRAFVFYPSDEVQAYEYLTQLLPHNPSSPNPLPTSGEIMFGGGAMLGGYSESSFLDNIGVVDDSSSIFQIESYLTGSLERYFGQHWGAESTEPDTEEGSPDPATGKSWGKGRVKAVWTGIMGLSADMQPWVGRVPKLASGRREPRLPPSYQSKATLAPSGEWISAGFSGEGMVHAWLSGKAVAHMVLGDMPTGSTRNASKLNAFDSDEETEVGDELELPKPFVITEKRLKKVAVEDLISKM